MSSGWRCPVFSVSSAMSLPKSAGKPACGDRGNHDPSDPETASTGIAINEAQLADPFTAAQRMSTISFSSVLLKFKTPCSTIQAPLLPETPICAVSRSIAPSFVVKYATSPCGVVAEFSIFTFPNTRKIPVLGTRNLTTTVTALLCKEIAAPFITLLYAVTVITVLPWKIRLRRIRLSHSDKIIFANLSEPRRLITRSASAVRASSVAAGHEARRRVLTRGRPRLDAVHDAARLTYDA
jgi:hypothetical protein